MDIQGLLGFLPLDQRARREWIKYALHCKGLTIEALARAHGADRRCVGQCLKSPLPKWERIIADALGVRPEQLWPERYGPDGKPNRKRGRPLGYSPKKHKAMLAATQYPEVPNR